MKRTLALAGLLVFLTAAFPPPVSNGVTPTQALFILKELKPGIQRVGVLWSSALTTRQELMTAIQRAQTSTGIKITVAEVGAVSDVANQFRELVRTHHVQALWIVENDNVMGSAAARSFVIRNATLSNLLLLAPNEAWVNEGAGLTLKKEGTTIRLVVNKAVTDALSISIPASYQDRTAYLAAN